MKFRNSDEKGVLFCIMSETEAEKYELPELNMIKMDLPYKMKEGKYKAVINETVIDIEVRLYQAAGGYIGKIDANGIELSVLKGKPLRRQDILRAIIKRLNLVAKNCPKIGVDVAG